MNEKTIHIIIIIVGFIVGFTVGWVLLHTNGAGDDTAREQFERTGEYQQTAIDSIESVKGGLSGSIESVDRTAERTKQIKEQVDGVQVQIGTSELLTDRSTELIEQSKSILQQIRERE